MPRPHKPRHPGVRHAGTAIANAWLVNAQDGCRVLIDTGHRTERALLVAGLARLGVRQPGDLDAVFLTHRHSDHAGNAAYLRERFGCAVVCHVADRPPLEGGEPAPRLAGRGAPLLHDLLCRVEDAFPASTRVDRTFRDGDVDLGFDIIHVGGHTEGSVLLYHRESESLFTGDALLAGLPVQGLLVRPRFAYRAYSIDAAECRANTRRYLRDRPRVGRLCAGHGPLVTSNVDTYLARLAS